MDPDEEVRVATELRDKLLLLVDKYGKYEHLATFTGDLKNIADEIDASIEDVEDVE